MGARIEHLISSNFAQRQGERVVFARNLLDTLRQRELEATAAQIASRTGLEYRHSAVGEVIAGVYRERFNNASGRFAMIDDGLGFSLVPWTPSLERHLGRHVSGIAQIGTVEWSFGRTRGPTIG